MSVLSASSQDLRSQRRVDTSKKDVWKVLVITKRLVTHLEMRSSSFMVCTATSLSLSRVMEIIRSWKTNTQQCTLIQTPLSA